MDRAILGTIAGLFLAGGLLVFLAPRLGADGHRARELRVMFWMQFFIVLPVLVTFQAGGWLMAGALALFAVRGVFELGGLSKDGPSQRAGLLAIGLLVGCGPAVLLASGTPWVACLVEAIATLAATALGGSGRKGPHARADLPIAIAVLGVSLVAVQILAARQDGSATLLLIYILVETCDSFAALAGRIWGRTPLLPTLSPSKTVEGLCGGLAVAIPLGAVLAIAGFGLHPLRAALVVAVILGAGLAGDMLTSVLKRRYGRKDFPPVHALHGGVLDIYDSLLAAIPVFLFIS